MHTSCWTTLCTPENNFLQVMCKKKKNAATNIKRAFSSDVNCSLGFQFAEKSTVNIVAVQRQGIFFQVMEKHQLFD